MTTATQQGRELVITVEGVEPFTVRPLPGRRGKELTDLFLRIATRQELPNGLTMETVLNWAVDGVDADGEWIIDGPNSTRIGNELTLNESEDVLQVAFYWSTVLGLDGVNVYLSNGGGLAGSVKALGALASTLGISPLTTSPSSVLESAIQKLVRTPPISTPSGGGTLAKLPASKQSRKPKQTKG